MADSTISILVRDKDNPCRPYPSPLQFLVDILHCDGTYLTWKGITYRAYALRGGIHDQVKVPPGCYILRAYHPCGPNVNTQYAMAIVGCNETVCVNLLPTGLWTCTGNLIVALQVPVAIYPEAIMRKIPKKVEAAIKALEEVKEYVPRDEFPPPLPVTIKEMAELVKEAEEKPKAEK